LIAVVGNFTNMVGYLATTKRKLASLIDNFLRTTCNFTTTIGTFTM
jgi:hypothetical protein